MYRHILIPTDGSELAEHGLAHGLALAKPLGAKVSVIFVVEPFSEMTGRFLEAEHMPSCARNRPRARWIARQMRPRRPVFSARRFKWRAGNPIKPSSQQPRTKAAISLPCHRMGAADFRCFSSAV
jgi:nucleotide-binding universal stress UspA family protein